MLDEVIYLSHPMTTDSSGNKLYNPDEIEQNIEEAMEIGYVLLKAGLKPFIPELNHYFDKYIKAQYSANEQADDFWLPWDLAILRKCDSFLYIRSSYGCDIELVEAQIHGLYIYQGLLGVISRIESILFEQACCFAEDKELILDIETEMRLVYASQYLRDYIVQQEKTHAQDGCGPWNCS